MADTATFQWTDFCNLSVRYLFSAPRGKGHTLLDMAHFIGKRKDFGLFTKYKDTCTRVWQKI